jgi:hypothetical protein
VTHANHFVSDIPVVDAIYDTGGSSLFRDHRLRQLLAAPASDRKVIVDDLIAGSRITSVSRTPSAVT